MNLTRLAPLKKMTALLLASVLALSSLTGCGDSKTAEVPDDNYRNTYEVFVYSFRDSNGDGIGDLNGVTEKLDYIKDLGFDSIWLTPICPSTTYHKYDVKDYEDIDPEYGTLDDYDNLVKEAHSRGIHIINDMVMNHTSSSHPWFLEAQKYLRSLPEGQEPDPAACKYVDFYNFSREPLDGYVNLQGTDWYYEARFWDKMPDLNLDNEEVQKNFADIAKFWTDHGCDGFRMDALTSYYTDDTNKSVEALGRFVSAVKTIDPKLYIVGEAWAGKDTYAKYYKSGIDSLFDFDFSGNGGTICGTVRGTKPAKSFAKAMQDEEELFGKYSKTFINAPFYTNHDMARSAGYYTGANDMDRVKLAEGLNLMMTGNAYIYYGEEIGMKGSGKKDENKRAPMYWNDDSSASGMCKGPSGMDDIKMKYPSCDDQSEDKTSILNYVKSVLTLRNSYPMIARGKTTAVESISSKTISAFTRTKEGSNYDFASMKGSEKWKNLLIIINTGDKAESVDVNKSGVNVDKLADSISTGGQSSEYKDGILTAEPFSISIFNIK